MQRYLIFADVRAVGEQPLLRGVHGLYSRRRGMSRPGLTQTSAREGSAAARETERSCSGVLPGGKAPAWKLALHVAANEGRVAGFRPYIWAETGNRSAEGSYDPT